MSLRKVLRLTTRAIWKYGKHYPFQSSSNLLFNVALSRLVQYLNLNLENIMENKEKESREEFPINKGVGALLCGAVIWLLLSLIHI